MKRNTKTLIRTQPAEAYYFAIMDQVLSNKCYILTEGITSKAKPGVNCRSPWILNTHKDQTKQLCLAFFKSWQKNYKF